MILGGIRVQRSGQTALPRKGSPECFCGDGANVAIRELLTKASVICVLQSRGNHIYDNLKSEVDCICRMRTPSDDVRKEVGRDVSLDSSVICTSEVVGQAWASYVERKREVVVGK
jgi:hypothetical protein